MAYLSKDGAEDTVSSHGITATMTSLLLLLLLAEL